MTYKKIRPQSGGNSLIEQVIAAPLEAAAKANSNMAHEQLAFVLKYCFEKTANESYTPRMINLIVTRQEIVESEGGGNEIQSFDTTINLPIITIVPLSSLAINKIEIDFNLEVTSMETNSESFQASNVRADTSQSVNQAVALRGKIGPTKSTQSNSNRKDQSRSNLEIKITAGPLPLPNGMLSLIDSFTKQIVPVELKDKQEREQT